MTNTCCIAQAGNPEHVSRVDPPLRRITGRWRIKDILQILGSFTAAREPMAGTPVKARATVETDA